MDEGGVTCELFTFITVSAHVYWTRYDVLGAG